MLGYGFYNQNLHRVVKYTVMKTIIGWILKIAVYIGLAGAILIIGDWLSLMDLSVYEQTGRMGVFGTLSKYPLMIIAMMFIFPIFVIKNMRIWKKFE